MIGLRYRKQIYPNQQGIVETGPGPIREIVETGPGAIRGIVETGPGPIESYLQY